MEKEFNTRPKSPSRNEAIEKALVNQPQYSNGVLIGNWVEERIECPKTGTLYFPPKEEIDYDKLKPESRQPDFRLNKLNSTQGNMPSIIRHDSHDACPNFASTNDLVYNHLPKPLCGPIQRYYKRAQHQWYPQPDLMKCFSDLLAAASGASLTCAQRAACRRERADNELVGAGAGDVLVKGAVPSLEAATVSSTCIVPSHDDGQRRREDSSDVQKENSNAPLTRTSPAPAPTSSLSARSRRQAARWAQGNVTEWGLRENMEYEWKCTDVSDYQSTLYEDTFVAPQPQDYLQRNQRRAKNSSFTKSFRFKMTKSKR